MNSFIFWTIQSLLIPAISPMFVGVIRKMKAKFQNRKGASIFQPYRDLWKLLHKDEIISQDASWISKVSPYIIFTTTVIAGASIPTFASFIAGQFIGDMILVIYILALGTFFLALSGIDSGGPFGGFGSSREMTISSLTEGM